MTRTVLHFALDSDTSGFFPQLAAWHDRERVRMMFGTLGRIDPWLRAHMERHGVPVLDCACPGRWAYPRGVLRLATFLRRHEVQILHTHLFDPSVVGLTAGLLARTPHRVMTRHYSDYHTRIDRPVHVRLDRLCTAWSDRVIAVSEHTARHLVTVEGAPGDKVRVIHNGIDFDRVRPSSTEAPARVRAELAGRGARIVLMAARLHPEKGYDTLLEALPALCRHLPDLTVWVAGGGPLEAGYRARASTLGLSERVRFLGFRHDLPDLISAADVLVLPSLAEAFGLVAAEALYLGVPVVASRVGGIPEIVDDGVDGLLVPPGDANALSAALLRVLADESLCSRLRGAGREKVAARFSFETMVRRYEAEYDALGSGR
jgi:glycosyltransferase involved in cell wall biosynthesis